MHCWHKAVRVRKAEASDKCGDIHVDTAKSHEVYRKWLAQTRPADRFSPDGERRPYWLLRPLKPAREFYKLPDRDVLEHAWGRKRRKMGEVRAKVKLTNA